MLGRLRADLESELRSRGVPVRVEYGPASPGRVVERGDVVVVEHDPAGDAIGPARAVGGNPRRRFTRTVRAMVTIHAKATVDGARRQDHEDRAQLLVDQALVAIDNVLRGGVGAEGAERRYVWRCTGGAFEQVASADTARPMTPSGATYVLRIEIERAVADVSWAGDGAEEVTLADGGISSTTKVYGSTGEGAGETSCGA